VEAQHRALLAADLVLGVRRAEHREHEPVHANRRLDHVRHVLLFAGLVKVLHRLAAREAVLREVVIAARGDALQLLRAEWELEHEVRARACVVSELVVLVFIAGDELGAQPNREEEVVRVGEPLLVEGLPYMGAGS